MIINIINISLQISTLYPVLRFLVWHSFSVQKSFWTQGLKRFRLENSVSKYTMR